MKYYIGESGSTGRTFDDFKGFLDAITDLASTCQENGNDCFEIEVIVD